MPEYSVQCEVSLRYYDAPSQDGQARFAQAAQLHSPGSSVTWNGPASATVLLNLRSEGEQEACEEARSLIIRWAQDDAHIGPDLPPEAFGISCRAVRLEAPET